MGLLQVRKNKGKSNVKPPCKDCIKREIGCHSKCDDYKAWSQEQQERKAKKNRNIPGTANEAKVVGHSVLTKFRRRH